MDLDRSTSSSSKPEKTLFSHAAMPASEEVQAQGAPLVNAITGHKEELKRTMSFWALLALSYSNMSVWTAIGGSLTAALVSGGPVVMVWGWIGVSIVSLMIAASLAELCSAWPHAAGQAFWTYRLAAPRWAPLLSYWTAMFNVFGAWAIMAAGTFILSNQVLGLALSYNPDYIQQPSHLVGVYLGLLFCFFLCNLFAVRIFDAASKFAAALSITATLAIMIALAVATPVKQPAKFVFTEFLNSTGWESVGLVVILGLLQSAFTIIGYDAAAHLCEEAHDAARLAPLAVFGGVALSAIAGLCFIITLLFCIGDVDSVVTSFTPLMVIFENALGLPGATFCMLLNLLSLFLAMVGILCASSRNVWSMARDKGFPGYQVLGRINPTFVVPVEALLLNIAVPAILVLIYLGSTVIFYAFFQLTTIGYLGSYFVPIALLLFRGRQNLPPAPWRLPDPLSKFCNSVALAYIVFVSVMFCVPNYAPVLAANMNYTSPVLASFVLFGTVGWFAVCRRTFVGPAVVAHGLTELMPEV